MASPDSTGVVVCGAAGRMGRRLVALAHETPGLHVAGAVEAPGNPALGSDAGDSPASGGSGLRWRTISPPAVALAAW